MPARRTLALIWTALLIVASTLAFLVPRASAQQPAATPRGGHQSEVAWSDALRRSARQALGASPWPASPFARSSVWNAPLSPDAAIAAHSRSMIEDLLGQLKTTNPWINTSSYSVPVYVVGRSQRRSRVVLDTSAPTLQAAIDAVPIPADAQAARGSDEHMVVWQPSTNTMWEFWLMHKVGGVWHARWGGRMGDLSRNPGYFENSGTAVNWGATATGLPLLGGLISFEDLERGSIDHALAISIPDTEARDWVWPAQRTDGNEPVSGSQIPEGTRFRLSPRLDLSALHLSPLALMIARAAQRYGIIVRDKGGAVSFYGQEAVTDANPWAAALAGAYPDQALAGFPWSQLEVLRARSSCCWSH